MTDIGNFEMNHAETLAKQLQDMGSQQAQPQRLLETADRAFAELFGHLLFTVTRVVPGRQEIERIYSSRPDVYPVGGRKPIGHNYYASAEEDEKLPFYAASLAGYREIYPDIETMESLGIGSVMTLPVVFEDAVLGTVNLHGAEGAYQENHLPPAMLLASRTLPAFLSHRITENGDR